MKSRGEDEMINNVILYTWQDVERYLYMNKTSWPKEWNNIDVYSDEIVIYSNDVGNYLEKESKEFLSSMFKGNYKDNKIVIAKTKVEMSIIYEQDEMEEQAKNPYPLFKDFSYVNEEYSGMPGKLSGVDVMAFHSFKGGVGRTLSLIVFVRDMVEQYGLNKKVLIVDGDIEAPGLTWLGKEQNGNYQFSYIDLLNIISSKGIDEDIYTNISNIIKNITLNFDTGKVNANQYFLPAYRYESQLLDVYSNPERIMNGDSNKYVITDALSVLGRLLGVDMVLVDLRAGISEYSAPLLFDPRVKKIVVTSTSEQSIVGTELLLKQIKKQKNNTVSNIILTKVDDKIINKSQKDSIYQRLLGDNKESDDDMTRYIEKLDDIIEVENDQHLVHLGGLDEICKELSQTNKVTSVYHELVKSTFMQYKYTEHFGVEDIKNFRISLHEIAQNNVTAEADDKTNLLVTNAVMRLGNITNDMPRINILGAKGSGKTYLYKQMMAAQTWNEFINIASGHMDNESEILICPVLCSEDRSKFISLVAGCRDRCNESIHAIHIEEDMLSVNEQLVKKAVNDKLTENDWTSLWEHMIWDKFENVSNWNDLENYLQSIDKKIVFIFDGLETLFSAVIEENVGKAGIKSICKNVMNHINEYQLENVGMIIFLRKDIAELAMDVNFEQFRNQYQSYELNWSQTDALKLAWKLAENAAENIGLKLTDNKENVPVYNLSAETVENNLNRLWGKKMGPDGSKTAGTIRWVLASLSDFNGQLQARDIVRFLEYATEDISVKKEYQDRLLTPEVMKEAIKKASTQKLKEVEAEIYQLHSSFDKLKAVHSSKKQVPLTLEVLDELSQEDIKSLERFGYLKEADGEYYIAENIRHALGYNKTRRGGIKLVSLLVTK